MISLFNLLMRTLITVWNIESGPIMTSTSFCFWLAYDSWDEDWELIKYVSYMFGILQNARICFLAEILHEEFETTT